MEKEDEEILKEIKEVEERLRKLRLSLEHRKKTGKREDATVASGEEKVRETRLKVGDRVRILNPSKGQHAIGKIVIINKCSGFHFVATEKGRQEVRRLGKNLIKIEEK